MSSGDFPRKRDQTWRTRGVTERTAKSLSNLIRRMLETATQERPDVGRNTLNSVVEHLEALSLLIEAGHVSSEKVQLALVIARGFKKATT